MSSNKKNTENTAYAESIGSAEKIHNNVYSTELQEHDLCEETECEFWSENTEAHLIKETPFRLVRIETKWTVQTGMYRMSEQLFDSWQEALEDGKRITWGKISQLIYIMIQGRHQFNGLPKDN